MKQLLGKYKFKNRRVIIREVTSDVGQAFKITTKRLKSYKNREIVEHEVCYSKETLQNVLYSLDLFMSELNKK